MAAKHRVNSVAMHYMYNTKLKREETLLILYNKRSQYGLFVTMRTERLTAFVST